LNELLNKQIKDMRKILLILLVFTGAVIRVDAQDTIMKKDGNEIYAKVIEVGPDAVKYKIFDYQDGPVYVLPNSEIFMIKYENGTKGMFGATSTGYSTPAATPPEQSRIPVAASPYRNYLELQMRTVAPDIYQRYRKGSRQSKVGLGLVIGGTAALATGAMVIMENAVDDYSTNERNLEALGTGVILYLGGMVCATVGTPIMIVGYVRKGKAKREYLRQYGNRAEYKSPLQLPHFEIRTNGIAFVF
jgi:hypothetical protein